MVDSNTAMGGVGGPVTPSSLATAASAGGDAAGGAVYNLGFFTSTRCAFTHNIASGGLGGDYGGSGGAGTHASGNGGNASGGAIAGNGQTKLLNSILAANNATGGQGGFYFAPPGPASVGGNGGNASAGAMALSGFSVLEFVTAAGNSVTAGLGAVTTTNGSAGSAKGTDMAVGATIVARSNVLASGGGSCDRAGGVIVRQGANLSLDDSCSDFTLIGDPQLQALRVGSNGYPILFPAYRSLVIDAAVDCQDDFGQAVSTDLQGTPRPQGLKCDLGAIEADYVFVDGFEGT